MSFPLNTQACVPVGNRYSVSQIITPLSFLGKSRYSPGISIPGDLARVMVSKAVGSIGRSRYIYLPDTQTAGALTCRAMPEVVGSVRNTFPSWTRGCACLAAS